MNEWAARIRRLLLLFTAVLVVAAATGCGPGQKSDPIDKICLSQSDKTAAMEAADDVLARMHFTIDKSDPEQGIMTTRPLSGAQLFEFWRKDNATPYANAEANLHTIRRSVDLSVYNEDGQTLVKCDVSVKRLSIPEMEIAGMSQAAQSFTASDATLQKLELNTDQAQGMAWIDLGPDPALEKRILDMIHQKVRSLEGIN